MVSLGGPERKGQYECVFDWLSIEWLPLRSVSLDSQCKADRSAVQHSCPNWLLGKHLLGMSPFPWGDSVHVLEGSACWWQDQHKSQDNTTVYKMGKHRNTTKAGGGAHKNASPTSSSHGGELCDIAQDLVEDAASQMGTSAKMPFRFTQSSRLPSTHSLLLEHGWTCSTTPNDWTHYCVHTRVTLGEGSVINPQPPCMECIADLQYIARSLSGRLNHQSCGPRAGGGNPVLWKALAQWGASLLQSTGHSAWHEGSN